MKKRILAVVCIIAVLFTSSSFETFAATRERVSKATILSAGDLLISSSILEGAKRPKGLWDFNGIFESVEDIVKSADYAVINLETSFGGKEMGYCGFPKFNTPQAAITAAKNAGFDMFLTASNHSYDLGYDPLINKLNILERKGLDYIGTRKSTIGSLHKVVKVNGIKIGMLNYTQETSSSTKSEPILNATRTGENGSYEYVVVDKKAKNLIASYNRKYLDEFYDTLESDIKKLKQKGAEVIIAYPHWGSEYNIDYNEREDEIAQKMCDLGVDAIVGGHPHVVEPVKVYTSKISGKSTVCLHSMGNFVSSMRNTDDKDNANYVEDGALFKLTVSKYSDGTCAVSWAQVIPTWVKKTSGKYEYEVIPLDDDEAYSSKASSKYQSYTRTNSLVEKGVKKFNGMPKMVLQPSATKVKAGNQATFKCGTIGSGIKYQWQYSSDGGKTWKNSSCTGNKSAVGKVKTKKSYSGRYYRCKVYTSYGTVYTKKAKLTVY